MAFSEANVKLAVRGKKGSPARIVRGVLKVSLYFQQVAFPSAAHDAVLLTYASRC
jgi:hypothetical protein